MRRRLVCDFERPTCNKCRSAGVACPGYDEKKPLRWLAPGKATSRPRKRRFPPGTDRSSSVSSEETTNKQAVPQTSVGSELLRIPNPGRELKSETCTMVEAVRYFNDYVYPDFRAMHELAPNPYLGQFPLDALHQMPMSICHTLVYLALGHRIHRVYPEDHCRSLARLRPSLYQHRGLALRSLTELMGNLSNQMTIDLAIASIMLFLIVDARQLPSVDWQHHFTAAMELIKLRGGLASLAHSSEYLKPLILHLLILGVMANTTTPPSQHIPPTSQLELIDIMTELYGDGIYPILLCPPYLLMDVIKINNLRFQTTSSPITEITRATAHKILEHIEAFSPEDWTGTNSEAREDWLLLGRMYKSSVALYCISSLQNLSILPSSKYYTAMRTVHGTCLYTLLPKVTHRPRIKHLTIWPLVVAGMQAVDASPNVRRIVDELLSDLSKVMGCPTPMLASAVFHRFWTSGQTRWDECFDKAYVFVT
ncbi:fungal-specific transcription factor domain-containing protein [Aspergillus caelatus]|uniref:Fungal-specific transcription factor domain-containing protein n=1 Tax=Aspergillus caelatus TaxID=61420 RepID=A0A5N7AL92_9EURO|nr:fungal-specific transcription factor domain-containing protein [Aspergillus caelatus]KAE8370637.1 fungal-specific transcription factor domain-containing protein [Aspergillus caelatus]